MSAVGAAAYPTPSQILQSILDAIVFGYVSQGLDPPNVLPGSDHYRRAEAFAERVSIAIANNLLSEADSNPLTAVGAALIALAAVFGVQPRPASPAADSVTIVSTATVTIPQGFIGSTPDGQQYRTTATTTVSNGGAVTVIALAAGFASNQVAGTKFAWSSAAIGALGPTASVGSAGLTGGFDADNDDRLRARLLQKLSAPPVGGNWSSVVQWVENASASVEAAYVYPAARGAASYDVAVTAVGGQRTLPDAVLAILRAAVLAQMPGQNDLNLTTVTPQLVDVVLSVQLALPQSAGGAGGGYRDAAPWPAELTKVTAYNSGTQTATVNSTAAPTTGNSIGIWDPTYVDPTTGIVVGIMREYTIASGVGGSTGAWTFQVTSGFGASPLGAYVSAGALSLVAYASTFAAAAAALGPGEKTVFLELLPRALRQPTTDSGHAPPSLSNRLTAVVETTYPEVINLSYLDTYTAGTSTPQTTPNVPATTQDPPGILVLNSLAFIKG